MTADDRAGAARTRRHPRRRLVLLVATALLLALPAGSGVVRQRAGRLGPVLVLSGFEAARDASVARDCGYSQQVSANPPRSLWLFCDTPVYVHRDAARYRSWVLKQFINGSTAAVGATAPGRPPGQLAELPAPGTGNGATRRTGMPQPFLSTPAGLVTSAGQPCDAANGAYAASWISGVARVPSSTDLLITFNDYCVQTGTAPAFLHEGFGLVQYDPGANILSSEIRVFSGMDAGGSLALGSPVFAGRYLYLFGPVCTEPGIGRCARGIISVVRVGALPLDWANPLGYRWWSRNTAAAWTSDRAAAASIIDGARPYAVSVADFTAVGHGFVLVEQTDVAGGFEVFQAPAPAGSWAKIKTGRVPCGISHGGSMDLCRAIIGHPELSTRSRLALTYFDPGASVYGHVMADWFRW